MRRKEGFSLVELLIVLAVMAALIATITPVALNAIKKAKATQVAQNLKTLASSFENSVYVNNSATTDVSTLARDVDSTKYSIVYTETAGTYEATITYSGKDVDAEQVANVLKDATGTTGGDITYNFEFVAY